MPLAAFRVDESDMGFASKIEDILRCRHRINLNIAMRSPRFVDDLSSVT